MEPRRQERALALALVLAALALVGCGGSDGEDPAVPADPAALDGRSFASTAVTGRELVPGTTVAISFDGGGLSASAGCNAIFGPYRLAEGRIRVASLGETKRGCEPDRLAQDRWLVGFLEAGPEAEAEGEGLTLTGGGATIELAERDPEGS